MKISESSDGLIKIYVAIDEYSIISKTIFESQNTKNKFDRIVHCIFRNITNKDLYEKYKDFPGTSSIKLSKGYGKSNNIRVYCKLVKITKNQKEINIIVLSKLHHKKNQELSNKEKAILKSIQKSDYDYKEWD